MDQAVDEAVKKILLESCEVNADKVRPWGVLPPCHDFFVTVVTALKKIMSWENENTPHSIAIWNDILGN